MKAPTPGGTNSYPDMVDPGNGAIYSAPFPWDAIRWVAYPDGDKTGTTLWQMEVSDEGFLRAEADEPSLWAGDWCKYTKSVRLDELRRRFAAKQALSLIDKWDAPSIVKKYLESAANGNECRDLRDDVMNAIGERAQKIPENDGDQAAIIAYQAAYTPKSADYDIWSIMYVSVVSNHFLASRDASDMFNETAQSMLTNGSG